MQVPRVLLERQYRGGKETRPGFETLCSVSSIPVVLG